VSVTVQFVKLCWLILVLYWIVSSFSVKAVKERLGPRGWLVALRLPIICILIYVVISSSRHGWDVLGARCLPDTLAVRILGDVAVLTGLVFAIWARTVLGGNWSSSVTFKENHELIQRGPYRFVRHPIYTGILVMTLGTAVVSGRIAAFVALILFFVIYWLKSLKEEEMLTKHFPEAYPAYQARTKALIPFLF
jgi:protein-S-isoprenylcysteine O-methyltransferase Ste14